MPPLPLATTTLPPAPALPLWRLAGVIGIGLTAFLIVALVQWPAAALRVLWDLVIPLLPIVFFVNPVIWRNVCPLATLNALTGSRWGARRPARSVTRNSWIVGLLLLATLVPARRFAFNRSGPTLAIAISVIGVVALGCGLVMRRRALFCNGLCPVLPVERLYGQHPLIDVGTSRCTSCSVCAPVGCPELSRRKVMAQTLGPERHDVQWLSSAFGAFVASFPGFVLGYFTTGDGMLASAPSVYMQIVGHALASFVLVAGIARLWRVRAVDMMPWLAVLAAGTYYWFAARAVAAAWGGGPVAANLLRGAVLTFLLAWLVRARRADRPDSRPIILSR